MTNLLRIDSKARKVGDSLVMTVPHRVVKRWKLKENDRLVIYLLADQAILVPLAYLGEIGEPTLLRLLTRTPDSQSSEIKSEDWTGDCATRGDQRQSKPPF